MGDDEVELATQRRRDFFQAHVNIVTTVVVLVALTFGVASRQLGWHIGLADGIVSFLAWSYLVIMTICTMFVLGVAFILPIFFSSDKLRYLNVMQQIGRGAKVHFQFGTLVNVILYPSAFYFSGHPRIAIAIFIMAFVVFGSILLLKKLGSFLVPDHYDYE